MKESIIYEYQKFLLGNRSVSYSGFFELPPRAAENAAIIVLRYVVEKLLRWSPEEMLYNFNKQVIKTFKLSRFIGFIPLPPEIQSTDYFYYAHLLYPRKIQIDERELAIMTYNRVLGHFQMKFPKSFFDDVKGRNRAIICLNYVLSNKVSFDSIEDMYETFAGEKGKEILKTYKLEHVQRRLWPSAIEYLHDSLADEDKSMPLLYYNVFLNSFCKPR